MQDLSQAGISKSDERMMEEKFAVMLLKLENVLYVASSAVDEFLQDLHFLMSSASLTAINAIVTDFCTKQSY